MNTAIPNAAQTGSPRPNAPKSEKALHAYAVFLAFATFLLVAAGGLVTSTGSGLAVPDWPLSFGQYFPPMKGGVLFEHGHRMIAGTIGLLTLVLAVWLWRGQSRRALKIAGGWAVAVVCTQAILGGVTVLLRLPALVSVSHACLGQIFFSIMVCIAVLTAPRAFDSPRMAYVGAGRLQRLSLMTTGFVFMQLILGAMLRHSTIRVLPYHMIGALLVAIHVILVCRRILPEASFGPELQRPALAAIALLGVQLLLGLYSWRLPFVAITTAHVATGALLLATCAVISMQTQRRLVAA